MNGTVSYRELHLIVNAYFREFVGEMRDSDAIAISKPKDVYRISDGLFTRIEKARTAALSTVADEAVKNYPQERIKAIKFVRDRSGLGLRECKLAVEDAEGRRADILAQADYAARLALTIGEKLRELQEINKSLPENMRSTAK